jgi:hypothetical protein
MAISTIGGSTAGTNSEYGGVVLAAGQIGGSGGKVPVPGGLPAGNYIIEFRGSPTQTNIYIYTGITPKKIATNVYTYAPNGYSNGVPAEANLITVPTNCDGIFIPSGYTGAVVLRKWTPATPATLTEYNWNATGQATAGRGMVFTKAGYHCAYGNSKHLATEYSSSSAVIVSTDAYSWSVQAYIGYAYAIAYGNGKFVLTYNGYQYAKVATSTTGSSWTERTIPTTTYWNWIHYCSSLSTPKWIVTGQDGKACTATDPDLTWSAANLPATTGTWMVRDGGGVAVAIAPSSQTYYTSTDLVTWTSRSLPAALSGDPYLTYHNGIFVISGVTDNKIYTSTNGINWSGNTAPTTSINNVSANGYPLVSGNGYFMLGPVATNGQAYYWFSTDGINWGERMLNSSYTWFTHIGDTWAVAMPYGQGSISTYRTTASADTLI